MNPNQTTKKILFWLGLSLPTVALLAMAWMVHRSNGRLNNSLNWVEESYKVLGLLEQTQSHILDAEAAQRDYLLTGNATYLTPYRTGMDSLHQDIAQLKQLTKSDQAQQSNLTLLEKMADEELALDPAKPVLAGQSSMDHLALTLNEQGIQKVTRLRQLLIKLNQDQQQTLSRRQQETENSVANSQVTSLVLIAAVALALILVVVILTRLEKLKEFVTVCAWTGQVRFEGQWLRLDDYLKRRFDINVSHSLSQEATEKMKKEMEELKRQNPPPPA